MTWNVDLFLLKFEVKSRCRFVVEWVKSLLQKMNSSLRICVFNLVGNKDTIHAYNFVSLWRNSFILQVPQSRFKRCKESVLYLINSKTKLTYLLYFMTSMSHSLVTVIMYIKRTYCTIVYHSPHIMIFGFSSCSSCVPVRIFSTS